MVVAGVEINSLADVSHPLLSNSRDFREVLHLDKYEHFCTGWLSLVICHELNFSFVINISTILAKYNITGSSRNICMWSLSVNIRAMTPSLGAS